MTVRSYRCLRTLAPPEEALSNALPVRKNPIYASFEVSKIRALHKIQKETLIEQFARIKEKLYRSTLVVSKCCKNSFVCVAGFHSH